MNGHKSRTKVLIMLSAVAITSIRETFTLSPFAFLTIVITAMTTLVFVPRFILSSTDHCKIALIVSKYRQKERTLKFQSLSLCLCLDTIQWSVLLNPKRGTKTSVEIDVIRIVDIATGDRTKVFTIVVTATTDNTIRNLV